MGIIRTAIIFLFCCANLLAQTKQPIHLDKPFLQDYSIKYYLPADSKIQLNTAFADRNGVIKIHSSSGLMQPHNGRFLYPGEVRPDQTYRSLANKKISAIGINENQFVFLDEQTVLSNAWAGTLLVKQELPQARLFVGGQNFDFLLSDGHQIHYLKAAKTQWKDSLTNDNVREIRFHKTTKLFWILGAKTLYRFSPVTNVLEQQFAGADFTSFDFSPDQTKIIIGTGDGYLEYDLKTQKQIGSKLQKLPCTEITAVQTIQDKVWFGTNRGAFVLRKDGRFDYYQGERWLPGDVVKHIAEGPNQSVLILTEKGLGQINFKWMTLHEKAVFFEEQVRARHIRHGFNASLSGMNKGDLSTGYLSDSDNDGLWTSMYLGAEIFRYVVTKEPAALQNCRESLDAMERLYTVNPVPGFPARSFERSGMIEKLADPERWQHAPDPAWDWKSTTSSDEAIGHIFALGAMAELTTDPALKKRAIVLIDTLMAHILKNDLYLIDYDGKPTTWGRWNPSYVNAFPLNVGDRKLNASNIIAMLQTAYYFTKKPIYKEKAFELLNQQGYFENLMRPMSQIGYAPADADEHSKKMSDAWNHSDDEMYFLGYWGLYRYALNDTLKRHYKKAILDHWQAERPEKEGLWNIFTALTGTPTFDLKEAVWYLQEHPLDLIDWIIVNSQRQDIEPIPDNFRSQTIGTVLPPDERPIQRHNANMFILDRKNGNGTSEHSAGDIWLLPYWLGRYFGVISGPKP